MLWHNFYTHSKLSIHNCLYWESARFKLPPWSLEFMLMWNMLSENYERIQLSLFTQVFKHKLEPHWPVTTDKVSVKSDLSYLPVLFFHWSILYMIWVSGRILRNYYLTEWLGLLQVYYIVRRTDIFYGKKVLNYFFLQIWNIAVE